MLKTNAQHNNQSSKETICKPNEKRKQLMESEWDLEGDVEHVSDEVNQYKLEKKDLWIVWSSTMVENELVYIAKTILHITATSALDGGLFNPACVHHLNWE